MTQGSKNKLSFCCLIRQINIGISKGCAEEEIVEGMIKAAEQGSSLRDYLDTIGVDALKLPRLYRMLRIHFKEKRSSYLFHELANLVQSSKDDTREFISRALTLRHKILFVNEELDSRVKYTKNQIHAAFLNVIDNML